MGKKTVIVKVQRPLFAEPSNPSHNMYLVYDKARKMTREQGVPPDVARQLKSEPKLFFEATTEPGYGAWVIGRRVEKQDW